VHPVNSFYFASRQKSKACDVFRAQMKAAAQNWHSLYSCTDLIAEETGESKLNITAWGSVGRLY
jgi:hypothetical protein